MDTRRDVLRQKEQNDSDRLMNVNMCSSVRLLFRQKPKAKGFYPGTNLERCVEHDQFGTCGYDVIALVGFHKAHVNITLRFSSCEGKKKEKYFYRKGKSQKGICNEGLETEHTRNLNNHYGSGPLTATSLLHHTDN